VLASVARRALGLLALEQPRVLDRRGHLVGERQQRAGVLRRDGPAAQEVVHGHEADDGVRRAQRDAQRLTGLTVAPGARPAGRSHTALSR